MDQKYYLNDDRIDKGHEEMMDIIEKFLQTEIPSETLKEEYYNIINNLYKHTVIHFKNEEGLMLLNVPKNIFEDHKFEHLRIRNLVRALKKASINKEDVLQTLSKILVLFEEHIINYDMLIKDYL